ncbi:MAG: class I SAM-dependent methyltransferase [Candidatus Nanoarchaeia archaeon]
MSTLLYVKNFLKDKDIATIAPSSSFSVKKICKKIDFSKRNVIVEYGPGDGVFTFSILKKMTPDSRLIVIEKNENFAKYLRRKKDPRLVVIQEDAQKVGEVLEKCGEENADYVLSGIPISFFDHKGRKELMRETYSCLKPKGKFLVYQFNRKSEKYLKRQFDRVKKDFEILNLPPLSIFEAIKISDEQSKELKA